MSLNERQKDNIIKAVQEAQGVYDLFTTPGEKMLLDNFHRRVEEILTDLVQQNGGIYENHLEDAAVEQAHREFPGSMEAVDRHISIMDSIWLPMVRDGIPVSGDSTNQE